MTPAVYHAFEEICSLSPIHGRVLEVGAVPGPESLLRMASLRAASLKVGINMDTAFPADGGEIIQANANRMDCFASASFDCVVCNATLEHDRCFWKTIAEIHRVTAPGGLIVIGVPGYAGSGLRTFAPKRSVLGIVLRVLAKITTTPVLREGTVILGEHNYPGDYYRFSEQAVREVFLAGLVGVSVRTVLTPPRLIGWGIKP
ncbi:hypothetical protein IMCC26134_10850 [Verrucomicrobia bacterium IMCC26134]|nr:hypothetical protein IMCC26134_10850 [Verrucomicrobia bacterium IMCC26134]